MGSISADPSYGHNQLSYTPSGGLARAVYVYKSSYYSEAVYPALLPVRNTITALIDTVATAAKPVIAAVNANYIGSYAFNGIFYANGQLSKDGEIDISSSDSIYTAGLGDYQGGWWRYSPSMCITWSGKSEIHWFSNEDVPDVIECIPGVSEPVRYPMIHIAEGVQKFRTIVGGQHCLIYKGANVCLAPNIRSNEGRYILNASSLGDPENHYNDNIGGRSYNNTTLSRTLYGHNINDKSQLLVVTGGLSLPQAAELMLDLGCFNALNMDGAVASMYWYNGSGIYPNSNLTYTVGSALCVQKENRLDLNDDGRVNIADVNIALSCYPSTVADDSPTIVKRSDVNGDGVVDLADLSTIYANFTRAKTIKDPYGDVKIVESEDVV